MTPMKTLLGAFAVSAALAAAPTMANAQQQAVPVPIAPEKNEAQGFDGYRALAISAGVIGGVIVAGIVTEGLIIPVYTYAAGGPAVVGAGPGAFAAAPMTIEGMGGALVHVMQESMSFAPDAFVLLHSATTVLGGVAGGYWADAWYSGN